MHPALQRVAAWLRAGYPQGIPDADYVPLLAILRRRLSEEETRELGDQLVRDGIVPADRIDVGVGFLKITDELASESEVKRVSQILSDAGWHILDEPSGSTGPGGSAGPGSSNGPGGSTDPDTSNGPGTAHGPGTSNGPGQSPSA